MLIAEDDAVTHMRMHIHERQAMTLLGGSV
jgi:hypothetical protein